MVTNTIASSSRNHVHTSIESKRDRISKLSPNEIGHILSRLPTKDAVQTSVLSRAWEYKWGSVYDIAIDDKHGQSLTKNSWGSGYDSDYSYHHRRARHNDGVNWNFLRFVIQVLFRTNNTRLRSFSLLCDDMYSNNEYLETFISEVLRRNVQNLTILASINCKIESTRCFSGWTSLVECNLSLTCTLYVPVNDCFPNLKKLRLAGAYYGAFRIKNQGVVDNTRRIFLNFTVLEALELKYCEWLDVDSVEIQAPELIECKIYCLPELKSYEIKIVGPKLAKFESADGTINNFVVTCPSVTYAVVNHYAYDHHFELLDQLGFASHALIKGFPNVECLKLSSSVVNALVEPSLELVLPTFDKLKELEILCGGHIKDIAMLLQALPPLESLTLQLSSMDKNEQWEHLALKINLSRLKKVTFIRFIGTERQYDFAKFILKQAKNLARMHLAVRSEWVMTKIKARLSEMKPKNSSCILDVTVRKPRRAA